MRKIPQAVFNIAKRRERLVLRVYDDENPNKILFPSDEIKGVLTAGYGHTGNDVKIGMNVTCELALQWLSADIERAAFKLLEFIDNVIDELTDNQYGALVDFVFNVGAAKNWTIWKVLNARQFNLVPRELARFVNAKVKQQDGTFKTVKLAGLVARRNDEIELWSLDEPGSINKVLPSSVTRAIETPPTAASVKSAPMVAAAVAAVAAMPAAYSQASAAINPLAHILPHAAVAALSGLGAVAAGIAVLFGYLHKQAAKI